MSVEFFTDEECAAIRSLGVELVIDRPARGDVAVVSLDLLARIATRPEREAQEAVARPMRMLVDRDQLRTMIEESPDDECEAGMFHPEAPAQPVAWIERSVLPLPSYDHRNPSMALVSNGKTYAPGEDKVPLYLTPPDVAETIARLEKERDEARQEAYDLKYAVAGGEDAPGSAHAVTVADVVRWRKDDQASLEAAEAEAARLREAVKLPRLTDAIIRAACKAHYGSDEIDGIAMTSKGHDWNFRQAFKRMWSGVRSTLDQPARDEVKP